MDLFLSSFIDTLSTYESSRVGSILDASKVDKRNLESLVARMENVEFAGDIAIEDEIQGRMVDADAFVTKLQDVQRNIEATYARSNEVSTLLERMVDMLDSEVQSLSSEIDFFDKTSKNYAFLLADSQAYDYGFVEGFDNEINRDRSLEEDSTDRASQWFSGDESAAVNPLEGTLTIGDVAGAYDFTAGIVETNVEERVEDTGIDKLINNDLSEGWRRRVITSSSIKGSLPSFAEVSSGGSTSGFQVLLELSLQNPSQCDSIRLEPFAHTDFELLQVELLTETDGKQSRSKVLSSAIDLEGKPVTVYFPSTAVSRVYLYLQQPTYERASTSSPSPDEEIYRRLNKHFVEKVFNDTTSLSSSAVKRIATLLSSVNAHLFSAADSLPESEESRVDYATLMQEIQDKKTYNTTAFLVNQSLAGSFVLDIAKRVAFQDFTNAFIDIPGRQELAHILRGSNRIALGDFDHSKELERPPSELPLESGNVNLGYKYSLGFRSVRLTASVEKQKAVFISTQHAADGDIGQVRIRTEETQVKEPNTSRDDGGLLTSVEYSVSNSSSPTMEGDWVSILPVETDSVVGERFFPDPIGKGYFRFGASLADNVILYKNGFTFDIDLGLYGILSEKQDYMEGLSLPPNSHSSFDVLTVDYTPALDYTVVDFTSQDTAEPPLVSAFDDSGVGEYYDGMNMLSLQLKNLAYVDTDQVNQSSYDSEFGLQPYSPVTIVASSGEDAINLTNYAGGVQSELDPDEDALQFVHSGKTIVFNKPVTSPIRIYYQFYPNNARTRVVLRANSSAFVSPTVSTLQLKAKTRHPTP